MTGFKNLLLAFTVLSASTAAFAADDSLANQVLRKSAEKEKKFLSLKSFSTIDEVSQATTWGAHLGQQNHTADYSATYARVSVSHNGIKLRPEDLSGRYDLS